MFYILNYSMNIITPCFAILFLFMDKLTGQITTSEIFATFISLLALGSLYYNSYDLNVLYDINSNHIKIFNITMGYFLYDIFICLYRREKYEFILHAIISLLFSFTGSCGYFVNYGILLLLCEISTIFLYKAKNPNYGAIWKILFTSSFFIFRILIGSVINFYSIKSLFTIDNQWFIDNVKYYNPSYQSLFFAFIYLNGLFINMFILLNYFWFYKIIRHMIKHKNN